MGTINRTIGTQAVADSDRLSSAIYTGRIKHHRLAPKPHAFEYDVFMMYLDLHELEAVFSRSLLWSADYPAPAWFRRADFLRPAQLDLGAAVKEQIHSATGEVFTGSIRMLANLRYFGFLMNPLVCYYCFDGDECLRYIVAEVTNTPWRERCVYVLPCDPGRLWQRMTFNKRMHVSPFNPMDIEYRWHGNRPGNRLTINLTNYRNGQKQFAANLALHRQTITARSLNRTLLRYPWMTLKVCGAIYWQAARLYLKGVPFVSHPGHSTGTGSID